MNVQGSNPPSEIEFERPRFIGATAAYLTAPR
jgi:hypothetical protein